VSARAGTAASLAQTGASNSRAARAHFFVQAARLPRTMAAAASAPSSAVEHTASLIAPCLEKIVSVRGARLGLRLCARARVPRR
jgi:hypothetical protein